ncbi:MAG TPA: PEGA domain-containing protein [Gemmatimonadota bacterium]|nr:PEGA domain-containing protein [Gemmatimonadota bacterium]
MTGARRALITAALAMLTGCFEARERPTIPVYGDIVVLSDPSGADVTIDGVGTGATTPANLQGVPAGPHEVELSLRLSPNESFWWTGQTTVSEHVLDTLDAALQGGCGLDCDFAVDRGRVICRSTSYGDTCAGVFFSSPALIFPDVLGGSYAGGGRLLVAGVLGADAGDLKGDTVSTLVYRDGWIGRQHVTVGEYDRAQVMELGYWATAQVEGESLLGLSVQQSVIAADSGGAEDMLFLRFEIANVSADERYRQIYPAVPEGGYTFESLYLGFGLDADVGAAGDDLGTFDHELGLPFIYDADFSDPELGLYSSSPALVGTVVVERPAGASERTLTLWRREDDWDDGTQHGFAWRLLAGRLAAGDPIPDHPHPDIGYQPDAAHDYRFIDAHGPLVLAPGDTVTLTVALLLAEPVPGSYTPGQPVAPGDPLAAGRPILSVAGRLRDLAARAPELWERFKDLSID